MNSPNEATFNNVTTTDAAAAIAMVPNPNNSSNANASANRNEFYYVRKPGKHDVLCGRVSGLLCICAK